MSIKLGPTLWYYQKWSFTLKIYLFNSILKLILFDLFILYFVKKYISKL